MKILCNTGYQAILQTAPHTPAPHTQHTRHPIPHTQHTHTTLHPTHSTKHNRPAHIISVEDFLCELDAPTASVLVVVDSPELPAGSLLFSLFLIPSLLFCLLKQTTPVPFTLRGWLKHRGKGEKGVGGKEEEGRQDQHHIKLLQALAARGKEPEQ